MSNRTLVELNHDLSQRMNSIGFLDALAYYLNSRSPEAVAELERFGVRVFGMRHHSDGFDIKWGGLEVRYDP